ncbi:MAG TPA: hypothetical protein VKT32_09110 [Chthonomonadaceae bacterium]|nr:hypothetical protein [Chthonomonadaceae bacterium]
MGSSTKAILAGGVYAAITWACLSALLSALSLPFFWGYAFVFVLPLVILGFLYGLALGFPAGLLGTLWDRRLGNCYAGLLVASAWIAGQRRPEISLPLIFSVLLIGGLMGLAADLGLRREPARFPWAEWARNLYAHSSLPQWPDRKRLLVGSTLAIAVWLLVWAGAKTTGGNW